MSLIFVVLLFVSVVYCVRKILCHKNLSFGTILRSCGIGSKEFEHIAHLGYGTRCVVFKHGKKNYLLLLSKNQNLLLDKYEDT
ncbi:hypothetical protein [Candidatus Sneabacter namystus]|uniref:Uncharacterized protein n=1 Tax=Candidatus Sneabacter namystus TaxID=2601646 RepID=A0A5C0UIZ9_9RICK|nr:hypothetical protein [Candidatus Sneabacter namystus]QEK39730.1 hypothetical protein FZC37_02205 [Candidatus Sneabacter namystus]